MMVEKSLVQCKGIVSLLLLYEQLPFGRILNLFYGHSE